MEQNNLQTGLQEEALTAVSSGSFLVGSIPIAIATNGATAGGGGAVDAAAISATANEVAGGGASVTAATEGAAGGGGASACSNSGVSPAAGPSTRIQRHTHEQINALEMCFKENVHPNELKRNEIAQTLGMEPMQVLCWFQNKRTQMRSQSKREQNEIIRSENEVLRAEIQHFIEVVNKNICPECGPRDSQETAEEYILRSANIRLREEARQLKSAVPFYMAGQDSQNPSISQNPQNLPVRVQNSENLQIVSRNPQNLAIPTQNTPNLHRVSQNPQDLHTMSEMDNASPSNTTPGDRLNIVNLLTSDEFRQSITELVISAAEELKQMAMIIEPLWISSSVSEELKQMVDAEYHIPTPHILKRKICFARYCTQYSSGMWAVVDVSLDNILPTLRNTTCQKKPSGCVIQAMADGTSMITWIEHVYVDYNDVSNTYKHLIHSGLGFGAKRWVSILDRQGQRLAATMSCNVPSTRDFNNLFMSSPEGRGGILKLAERMTNNFFTGITGPMGGRWTKLNWNFGDDVSLMITRVMDDPGLNTGSCLSVSTSFVLSDSPKMVFDFLRDHRSRKEWDIYANGNDYEPVFNISYNEGAGNLVSIFKVLTRTQENMLVLQESWSDAVASHIVFSSTETRSIDVILGGGNSNCLPLLPSGFIILPDGSSFGEEGTSKTLLTVSFQVLVNRSPVADITLENAARVVQFLRYTCENIKHVFFKSDIYQIKDTHSRLQAADVPKKAYLKWKK
ncbi:homeobox-leucine zipper protein PROTODERMAL FACTOR 2-like [Apium graveolens]|uniref:homeobox-leucine zipper protein PROTODERMAL FACTOR 2-like n=1 Tax=Apium graveolens TaxID=4045 RepID=UPI003D79BE14